MKLRKIQACGFKSFADKIELVFEDGITAIVGPNGCGKSNVVDAVRWVLGAQSAKSLRGGQMLDVIFNGSGSRKAMGMAEVILTFDNSDHQLPIDFDSVSVGRRLYRSGESQYLINNQSCRLRDVRDLFMDTGIGMDAYSIIEQGKVDILLQSNPQERRSIFDEAAGISKYRIRVKEARRKLERVEQNLLRVQDVAEEVDKRLRSVRYQAGKAKNFQQYTVRLKELRVRHFLGDYHQQLQKQQEMAQGLTARKDEHLAGAARLDKLASEQARYESDLGGLDAEVQAIENNLVRNRAEIDSQQQRAEMATTRTEELAGQLARSRGRIRTLRGDLSQFAKKRDRQEALVQQNRQRQERQQKELAVKQEALGQQSMVIARRTNELDDEKSGLVNLIRETASLHNEVSSLDRQRQGLTGQKDRLTRRADEIRGQMEDALRSSAELQTRCDEIDGIIDREKSLLEQKKTQALAAAEHVKQLASDLGSSREARSGMLSRRQVLEDLESRLEGVSAGVREVLEMRSGGQFRTIRGMVAEMLEANPEDAHLVEVALNGLEQFLVADAAKDVLADADRLAELSGAVHVICLDRLGPLVLDPGIARDPRVKGCLADRIQCPDDLVPLAWFLLGRTWLVDDLETAMTLSRLRPDGRFLTPAGDAVSGAVVKSRAKAKTETGLISRKSQLRDMETQQGRLDEDIARLNERLSVESAEVAHLDKVQQQLRTAIYEATTEQLETRNHLGTVRETVRRLEEEEPLIAAEVKGLQEQIEQSVKREHQQRKQLDQLEQRNTRHEQRIEDLSGEIRQLSARREQIDAEVTECRVGLAQLSEAARAAHEQLLALKRSEDSARRDLGSAAEEIAHADTRLRETQRAILNAEAQGAELFMARDNLEKQSSKFRSQRLTLRQKLVTLTETTREIQQKQNQMGEEIHQAEMQVNEVRLRIENLTQRVREEYDLDLEEQYAGYTYEEDTNWEEVSAEIDMLKGKIDRLGNVNVDAITEQEDLEKRANFLGQQRQDLDTSRRQLDDLIRRIDKQSTEQFLATFETVRGNFQELFRKLMGGGKADVILQDPEQVLESGIEVMAKPPGKELQSISLLSGGEKTMTALALLLGIFKSKPAPFAILDEVDAALDEANNERYNAVIREFLAHSQFIVITHSKRTMSIADVLYGITMQEMGVSTKVSVKFDQQPLEQVA